MTISGSETCDRRNRRQSPQSKRDHALSVRKPPEYPQRQRIPGLCNSTSGACKYGCGNIITFDAHDARVQNATPLHGFETIQPSYQFIKALLNHEKGLHIDNDHFMIISPDEGSMNRAIYLANILGVDMGMYYKRLDYSKRINGRHPIAAYEFLGPNLKGKDMILIDDMILPVIQFLRFLLSSRKEEQAEFISALLSDCLQTDSRNLMRLIRQECLTNCSLQT